MDRFIPNKYMIKSNNDHPWLNYTCKELVNAREQTQKTDFFIRRKDECSSGIMFAYYFYIDRLKAILTRMKTVSREWCQIANQLLLKPRKQTTIPNIH